MAEMRGFVFAVIFMLIFAGLLASIPTDLQGQGNDPDVVTPIDPNIVSGFEDTETWNIDNCTPVATTYYYEYNSFNGRDWYFLDTESSISYFSLGAKVLYIGLWFGALDYVEFINEDGENHGIQLTSDEIEVDAEEGLATYILQYQTGGASAGSLIVAWNTTAYDDPKTAWVMSELYFMHGVGISTTGGMDIASLLIALLTLQLPDCPLLINLLLATPVYAVVVFVLWFIIKEMIPFLG